MVEILNSCSIVDSDSRISLDCTKSGHSILGKCFHVPFRPKCFVRPEEEEEEVAFLTLGQDISTYSG